MKLQVVSELKRPRMKVQINSNFKQPKMKLQVCLLYTSDAADEGLGVDLGGRRIIKKKWFSIICLLYTSPSPRD